MNTTRGTMLRLNQDINQHMENISRRVGGEYKLTLICRYTGEDYDDADILLSDDDFDKAISAIQRLMNREPIKEQP